jgi:hypothetical protein
VPGPTLAVALVQRGKFKRLDLTVRIAPAASPDHADRVAKRLGVKRRRRRAARH